MARNEQLIRQHKLLQVLETSRFGKTEAELRDLLVDDLGLGDLSLHTVNRDLAALQYAGYDLEPEKTERGTVWKAGPGIRTPPSVPISATELLALSLSRDFLLPLAGTPFWQGLETLWNKMRQSLPESVWKHFERHRADLVVRGWAHRLPAKSLGVLRTLGRAIQQHRIVKLEYQGQKKQSPDSREIEPLRIVVYLGHLYVLASVAGASPEEPLRHFKVSRVRKATILDRRFKPRSNKEIENYYNQSIGIYRDEVGVSFRIRFNSHLAPWVRETPFHPRQEIEQLDDGRIISVIDSAYPGEIIPRVLALGEHAEILEPESCRLDMARIASKLLAAYQPAPTSEQV